MSKVKMRVQTICPKCKREIEIAVYENGSHHGKCRTCGHEMGAEEKETEDAK